MEKFKRGQLWVDSEMCVGSISDRVSLGGVFEGLIRIDARIVEIKFDEPHPANGARRGTFPIEKCSVLWGRNKHDG